MSAHTLNLTSWCMSLSLCKHKPSLSAPTSWLLIETLPDPHLSQKLPAGLHLSDRLPTAQPSVACFAPCPYHTVLLLEITTEEEGEAKQGRPASKSERALFSPTKAEAREALVQEERRLIPPPSSFVHWWLKVKAEAGPAGERADRPGHGGGSAGAAQDNKAKTETETARNKFCKWPP